MSQTVESESLKSTGEGIYTVRTLPIDWEKHVNLTNRPEEAQVEIPFEQRDKDLPAIVQIVNGVGVVIREAARDLVRWR